MILKFESIWYFNSNWFGGARIVTGRWKIRQEGSCILNQGLGGGTTLGWRLSPGLSGLGKFLAYNSAQLSSPFPKKEDFPAWPSFLPLENPPEVQCRMDWERCWLEHQCDS